jgi:Big-like domain-containing protein/calcineurin-like phosphoesterase family protein
VHNLRHRLATATGLALLIIFLSAASFSQNQPSDFTVIVLPDTQFYSATYPQIFTAQTQWIAANRDALNIQLVIGVGDIVDGPNDISQWQNADASVRLLDGVVPYVLAIGNHDYDNFVPDARQTTNFNHYFGPTRYASYPWYGASNFPAGSNENFYANVNLGGTDYLILALEYIPRQAALDWADGVLKANANKPVILVTHSYMFRDNTTIDQCDTADNTKTHGLNGSTMWRNFVSQYPNITTVLSGHVLGVGQRSDFDVSGNLVNQMLVDYQGMTNGGNGYLRIMTFQPSLNRVLVQTYSPYLNKFMTDSGNQFTWQLSAPAPIGPMGTLKGKVRRGRIGVTEDCTPVPGATVASATSSISADETANYSVDSPSGKQSVSAGDEGYLLTTDQLQVWPNVTNDEPLFLYPDQYAHTLCDVSSAADHSVTFCSPTTTQVTSPVRIAAQSKVTSGFINLMQLYVDNVRVDQTHTNQLDETQSLAPGTHKVTAKARDDSGVFFSKSISITVPSSTTACDVSGAPTPSVTICSPANNATVTSPVQITAQSKDTQTILRMQLYVDGVSKLTVHASQLSTSYALAAGAHRLSVTSTNAANVTIKATVNVTVH